MERTNGTIQVNDELKDLVKDFLKRQLSSRGWQWKCCFTPGACSEDPDYRDDTIRLEGASKKHRILLSIIGEKRFMALKDGGNFFICQPHMVEQVADLKALSLKVERVAKQKLDLKGIL